MPKPSSCRASADSIHSMAPWLARSSFQALVARNPDWYRGNKPITEPGFDNTLFGKEAVRIIEKHDQKKPLFLYLAFTAPHTPFQAPKEYLDRYSNITDPNRRAYAAMISLVDDEVGNVVAALEKKGMRDNTLIVFQSDNGGVTNSMFSGDTKVD